MTGWLRRFLSRHCSAAAMERLVDPILTDIRIESLRATPSSRFWIQVCGVAALIKALAIYGGIQFWRFHEWPVDDRRVLIRTLAYSAAITVMAIPLLALPVLIRLPQLGWESLPRYFLMMQVLRLFAEIVVFALPIGLLIGLIDGFKGRIVSLRSRTVVMIVAILCASASFNRRAKCCHRRRSSTRRRYRRVHDRSVGALSP